MTDKTKPWFNQNHPEYAPVNEARRRLCESLDFPHDIVVGSGLGVTADGQRPCIRIYVYSEEDAKRIRTEFEGYEVLAVVSGPIVAY